MHVHVFLWPLYTDLGIHVGLYENHKEKYMYICNELKMAV